MSTTCGVFTHIIILFFSFPSCERNYFNVHILFRIDSILRFNSIVREGELDCRLPDGSTAVFAGLVGHDRPCIYMRIVVCRILYTGNGETMLRARNTRTTRAHVYAAYKPIITVPFRR